MLTGLKIAYAKEPEKTLVPLGWDVQWFTNATSLGTREVYPLQEEPGSSKVLCLLQIILLMSIL